MNTQRELEFLQRMAAQAGKESLKGKRPASGSEKKASALAAKAYMFLTPAQRSQHSRKQSTRPRMSSDGVDFKMFI